MEQEAIMKISNGRLLHDDGSAYDYRESPNRSGILRPAYLVMHYTAGPSAASSINWLTSPDAKASAHLVIGRDGSITQLVPFNRVAWHAGKSRWDGLTGLNNLSVGIELDNAGILTRTGSRWKAWFGSLYDDDDVIEAVHKHGGPLRGWHSYTEPQITAAREVGTLLVRHYKLKDVIGHDDIAPGRKQDPGPAFPMDSFRSALMGRQDSDLEIYRTTTNLNIRSGPGQTFEKLKEPALPKDTRLALNRRDGEWCFVDVLDENDKLDLSGWVHGAYIRRED
jgi:N-acetylmuramoyl-L-alanine amidase